MTASPRNLKLHRAFIAEHITMLKKKYRPSKFPFTSSTEVTAMYHSEAGCLFFPLFYRDTDKKASDSRYCNQKLKIIPKKPLFLLPFRQNLCFFCEFLAGAQSRRRKCSRCSSDKVAISTRPFHLPVHQGDGTSLTTSKPLEECRCQKAALH